MKRYINQNVNATAEPIYAGARVERGKIKFDWNHDNPEDDVILLKENVSGRFDEDGVEYVYAYEYNPSSTGRDRAKLRNYLKNAPQSKDRLSSDFHEFLEHGILQLDSYKRFSDFAVTITTHSSKSPSLTDEMLGYFMEYLRNDWISFELLKESYENVIFDSQEAFKSMLDAGYNTYEAKEHVQRAKEHFEDLKKEGELFQMKRFLPREIRSSFHNFLKFKNEEEQKVYEALQGVDVLIYDDFLTSGATVKEIVKYLRSFNDKNHLTVFVLVKQ